MGVNQVKDGFQGGSDNQLKVNADGSINVQATSGGMSNVDIFDSNGDPITATGGALNVNVVNPGFGTESLSVYNEVMGVAVGAAQLVLSYTVPGGMALILKRVETSGDCIATIEIEFDNVVNAKKRYSYTEFNADFAYDFSLPAGTVINIMATNNSPTNVASFNATLQGNLV